MSDRRNYRNRRSRDRRSVERRHSYDERTPRDEYSMSEEADQSVSSDGRMRRRKRSKIEKFNFQMQANLLLAFGVVIVLLLILIGVLIKINIKDGSRYAKKVLNQQSYTSAEIPFKRGDITDRNGIVMATSIKVYNLAIDPWYVLNNQDSSKKKYKDAVIDVLVDYFGLDKEEVTNEIEEKGNSRYYILKENVDTELVNGYEEYVKKYQKKNKRTVKGIWFDEEYERRYPLDKVASSVIGFTYDKNMGNWGIEGQYNSTLNGSTGRSFGYYDSELNLERTVKNAEDGNTVVSTIDSMLQKIVENHIDRFNADTGAKNVAVVIANPNNCEILAMASSNGMYDLNNPRDLSFMYSDEEIQAMSSDEKLKILNSVWRNYCISDSYEPGSTYKSFVIAAGLEEGLLKGDETFYCDGKEVVVEGTKPIKCAKRAGHGLITLEQSLMFSCNDALMAIGKMLGRERFAQYQNVFGFGHKTGIDLMGEGTGIVYDESGLNPIELATSSFGQGLNVTMVQMIAAFSSVVNGGYYYEPHVVKQILNSSGAVVEDKEPVLVKKVVSQKTSDMLLTFLKATVEEGTAKHAKVEGYSIGGKTGTAQKLPRGDRKYLVSFIGVAPCENPQMIIYSIVDEPNVDNQAQSRYAQELAANIMKDVFPLMDISQKMELISIIMILTEVIIQMILYQPRNLRNLLQLKHLNHRKHLLLMMVMKKSMNLIHLIRKYRKI